MIGEQKVLIRSQVINHFIAFLLFFYLLLDSINGVLLRTSFPFSITQPYKMLLMVLMLMVIANHSLKRFGNIYLISLVLFAPGLYSLLVGQTTKYLSDDLAYTLKLIFFFVSYYYFKIVFPNYSSSDWKLLRNVFIFNFAVLGANILLGTLGFGYSKYEHNVGTVGFFYAGNEVAGLLIVFMPVLCYFFYTQKTLIVYFLVCILFTIMAILLSTKTGILSSVLISLIVPLVAERNNLYRFTRTKLYYLIVVAVMVPIGGYFIFSAILNSGLLGRIQYFYNRSDFVTFLFSMRNLSAAGALKSIESDFSAFEILFGKSYRSFYEYYNPVWGSYGGGKIVEIDIFDLFMMYGMTGVLIIYGFWFKLLLASYKEAFIRQTSFYAPAIFVTNLVLILTSFIAGHVIYSALLAVFFTMLNAYSNTISSHFQEKS
ncbi:MAG: hypothetical protein ACI8Q1_000565 [Parvicella sp.]|jgi:hypothetical protein